MYPDCKKLHTMSTTLPIVFTYREFKDMFHNWMYFNFKEGKIARNMIINQIKYEPSEFETAFSKASLE